MSIKNLNYKNHEKFSLEPPEGGWGYVLTISMAVFFIVTVGPLVVFGMIFGEFLADLGDEASATATINCIFNTAVCFMGLVANSLLQNHSKRFVGVIGSLTYFLGSFLTAFTTEIWQIIITLGILQGIGFGLMLSAIFVSFNEYFVQKRNFMMSISQTFIAAGIILIPYFVRFLMDEFGFRGTVAILSAISLHAFVAVLTLQPVHWHMIKVPLSAVEMTFLPLECSIKDKNNVKYNHDNKNAEENKNISCNEKCWSSVYKFLELSLLKDLTYVNISIGIALSFMSDIMFMSLLPMILNHLQFNPKEIAYLMTMYTAADLLGRILLSFLTALVRVKSRSLFLYGTLIAATIRTAFILSPGNWMWATIVCAGVGLTRCLLQVIPALVLADYCEISKVTFPAAFGLYQAICGIVSLVSGQLSSLVASVTIGDNWVQHLLNLQLLLCAIPWLIEMMFKKMKK